MNRRIQNLAWSLLLPLLPVCGLAQVNTQSSAPLGASSRTVWPAANDDGTQQSQIDQGNQGNVDAGPIGPLSSMRSVLPTQNVEGSFFLPSFRATHRTTTNPCLASSACGGWAEDETVSGSFDLNIVKRQQAFRLGYEGGSTFYYGGQNVGNYYQRDNQFHSADISETLSFRKWMLGVVDDFSYSPTSAFGYSGSNIAGVFGLGAFPGQLGGSIGGAAVPSQSVLTGLTSRYSNTSAGDVDFQPTVSTQLNGSVSYSELRFPSGQYYDSDQLSVNGGFTRLIHRYIQLGLDYQYADYNFRNNPIRMETQSGMGLWGIRLRQFTLRLGGGGQWYTTQNVPGLGSSLRYTAVGDLGYLRGLTQISVIYHHGLSGGSGVLLGSSNDTLSGSVRHPLGRMWDMTINSGYSRNSAVLGNGSFNSTFVGASVRRAIRQNMGLSFTYDMRRQAVPQVCPVTLPNCSTQIGHDFGVGFDWSGRPIRIR
ncbi:MAG: hypothetical protein JO041_10425 [Acidobacteria bacterium]|nr:hypothetical protein [Acidobacteriota bacterium]